MKIIIIIAKIKTIIANLLTKMSDSECIISIKNIDGYEESETKDSSPVEVSQLSQELKQSPQKNHQNSLEILKEKLNNIEFEMGNKSRK